MKPLFSAVVLSLTLMHATQAHAQAPSPPSPGAQDVAFSDFIQTWDSLSELGWKLFKLNLPFSLAKLGIRYIKNGNALLIDPNGNPVFEMIAISKVSPDKTQRITEFGFMDMKGLMLLKYVFQSVGVGLEPFSHQALKQGSLSFKTEPGEMYQMLKIWIFDGLILKIETINEQHGDSSWKTVRLSTSDDSRVITYVERMTPVSHFMRYDLEHRVDAFGPYSSFYVNKVKLPGQISGTETYYSNDQQVDVKTFRKAFDSSVLTFVLQRWQQGFAGVLRLLDTY